MDDREILRHLLFDYTKEEIDTNTSGTFINPIDQALYAIKSYYKQKLLERMPKEMPYSQTSSKEANECRRCFNSALSQFKQIVEEYFGK